MKNPILTAVVFLAFSLSLSGQHTGEHTPLVCEGKIPAGVLIRSSDKYRNEAAGIEENHYRKKEEKTRKAFALEANFVLDGLLQSGLVLFNDEVTNYLNELAQFILKHDPALKDRNISVYTIRSDEVNAFATDRGDLFVTLGLLAQLEDEAQLAFILSHELVHVREAHALELFLNKEDLSSRNGNQSVLRNTVFDDEVLAHSAYSKELEMEADNSGIELFLKTDYDHRTLETVFDVLKYSYLPFDDEPFDPAFFQAGHYRFPESYRLETVKPIAGEDEDLDDAKSTHPNIGARRAALRKNLSPVSAAGKKRYLVSESRFKELREVARFELPMIYLHNDQLANAIYTSYLLLRKYPESSYLKKCIAKALYMNAKMRNSEDFYLEYSPEEVEGESQRLHYFLDKLDKTESVILALRYTLDLQATLEADDEIKVITGDLFVELAKHYDSLSAFHAEIPETDTAANTTAEPLAENPQEERSKYDKIRERKTGQAPISPDETGYWKYAFLERKHTEAFQAMFDAGQETHRTRQDEEKYWESKEGKAEWRKHLKQIKRHGHALEVDKIVIVNPYFIKVDVRRGAEVDYLKTETGASLINGHLEKMAAKAGLEATLLSVGSLSEDDVQKFNDLRFLNEWFGEQIEHYDLSLTPGHDQAAVNEIAARYGTDYFLWTGVVSVKKQVEIDLQTTQVSLLFPPVWPFLAYSKIRKTNDLLYYAILFDVKTGKRQILKFEYFHYKNLKSLLRGHFYDTFAQIRAKG